MAIPQERLDRAFGGRFEIERELGQGGMAVVYLAYDLEEHRQVALKVLQPELSSSVGGDRFLKEIEIGRRLTHTHILPLYRSGHADGLLYYTMQFADGESLRERLDRERQLPIEDALDIAREVASALHYAHRQGVVHRDIKPENIMLCDGGAVVMDFGIARALDEAGGERLTKTGLSMGTPAYMSPEQADGKYLDGRADQYSLACVLYEMLAGHAPFHGLSTQAVLSRHARDPVPPLSSARPTVSLPIETVIHKALSKVPADRFRSAQKFSDALDMAEQGVTPRGVTPLDNRAQPVHAPSFFKELKRRRVYKVAAGYGVIAFAIWQGLDALGVIIPETVQRGIIWATIGGFPVAVLFSWWFDITPQGIRRTQIGIPTPVTGERLTSAQRGLITSGVLAVAVAIVILARNWGLWWPGEIFDLTSVRPIDLEPHDFAVMPFRVTGSDATLATGMPELLDGFLHGELSDRDWNVADVLDLYDQVMVEGETLSKENALRIAGRLGAGRLVRGTIVGGPTLTVNATVERVPTGEVLGSVQLGSSETPMVVAQRLAVLLLNHDDWEDAVSQREIETAPQPALEAYQEAVRARWREEWPEALEAARLAQRLEPGFAAPAFIEWLAEPTPDSEARAWAVRDQFSERARTSLEVASAGQGPGAWPTARERIEFVERTHLQHPTWHELIDGLTREQFAWGAYAGRQNFLTQLRNLEIDDTTRVAGEEGVAELWRLSVAGRDADPGAYVDLADRLLLQIEGATREEDRFLAFHVAAVSGDPDDLDEVRSTEIHALDPSHFLRLAVLDGLPRDVVSADFERSIGVRRAEQITSREGVWAAHWDYRLAELRGQVDTAAIVADSLVRVSSPNIHTDAMGDSWWYLTRPIVHALYEPAGWLDRVEAAVAHLDTLPYAASAHPWYDATGRHCWPALGKILLDSLDAARSHIDSLTIARDEDTRVRGVCLAAVEALLEHHDGAPTPAPKLLEFDRLMRTAPREILMGEANLILAWIYEQREEYAEALEALYRRPNTRVVYSSQPGYLLAEGRLAARAGQTGLARARLSHYLLLRADPDPALASYREEAQQLLDGLPRAEVETGG